MRALPPASSRSFLRDESMMKAWTCYGHRNSPLPYRVRRQGYMSGSSALGRREDPRGGTDMEVIGKRSSLMRTVAVLMLLVSWKRVWADTTHDERGEAAVTHRVNSGAVWAWGYNGFGELADGTALQPALPAQVAGLAGLPAIAAGSDSAPLLDDSPRWASWNHVCRYQGEGKPSLRFAFSPVSGTAAAAAIASVPATLLFAGHEGTQGLELRHLDGRSSAGMRVQGSYTVRNYGRTFITGITGGNTIS